MPRNLDLTALRSFVTVYEVGGVTRAAQQLHLTQSAVSMQLKRLEEALDLPLLDRSGRGISLTTQGEQLLSYGRRILALNDEVYSRMTDQAFEGEITFGVPADIVYPHVPRILRRFDQEFPRVRVNLVSSYTRKLKSELASGALDLILTTEDTPDRGAETISVERLIWVGAPGGNAWRQRPLRLAFENNCIFRTPVQTALDKVDIPWEMAVESDSTRTIEATVSADLAVHAMLEGAVSSHIREVAHGGALPDLPSMQINLYTRPGQPSSMIARMTEMTREAFSRRAVAAA